MKTLRTLLVLTLALPLASLAANKEMIQLQRDVALLQDQVRTLQNQVDEQVKSLTVLLEQTLDRVNQLNTTITRLDSSVGEKMDSQQKNLVAPVANLGAKIDQLSSEFGYVRESVQDVSLRVGKLEQQMVDMKTTFATLSAPPPPPDTSAVQPGPIGTGAPPPAASAQPPAGVSAQTLYENAMRDKTSGKLDLAAQEFSDYLRWFSDTDLAANAEFYLGEIEFNKDNYPSALQHFDLVLEKYPENNKTADAFYMKGMTLVKMGDRTKAADEFYELLRRYPTGRLAPKTKLQLRNLGVSTIPPKRSSESR